jgi:hypothetical protein
VTLWDIRIDSNRHQLVKTLSIGVKIMKIIFQLVLVNNLSIWYIKKYVFNWYLKMAIRASNGLSIEIKHKFVISPMIERDGHKWSLFTLYQAHQSTKFKILWSRWRLWGLKQKVYRSMNSCTTFVHLGPYMPVCACVYNILSHTMSLFLWWRLENSFDIWLISLVVMAWVSFMLKASSKWGMS